MKFYAVAYQAIRLDPFISDVVLESLIADNLEKAVEKALVQNKNIFPLKSGWTNHKEVVGEMIVRVAYEENVVANEKLSFPAFEGMQVEFDYTISINYE